eukprot:364707-Chlamydomonas_euryale.AAC.22
MILIARSMSSMLSVGRSAYPHERWMWATLVLPVAAEQGRVGEGREGRRQENACSTQACVRLLPWRKTTFWHENAGTAKE